jgi:hypothetical protein
MRVAFLSTNPQALLLLLKDLIYKGKDIKKGKSLKTTQIMIMTKTGPGSRPSFPDKPLQGRSLHSWKA